MEEKKIKDVFMEEREMRTIQRTRNKRENKNEKK